MCKTGTYKETGECPQLNTTGSALTFGLKGLVERGSVYLKSNSCEGQNKSRTKWTCSYVSAGCAWMSSLRSAV